PVEVDRIHDVPGADTLAKIEVIPIGPFNLVIDTKRGYVTVDGGENLVVVHQWRRSVAASIIVVVLQGNGKTGQGENAGVVGGIDRIKKPVKFVSFPKLPANLECPVKPRHRVLLIERHGSLEVDLRAVASANIQVC